MSKSNLETRYSAVRAELRAEDGKPPKLVGHAAVFNSFSEDLGGFREIIRPGTFTRCLQANPDVRFMINHGQGGSDLPIARTGAGNLHVYEDQRGLAFEATLDPTDVDVQRILPKLRNGTLSNMSFAFRCLKDQWRTENGQNVRELHDADVSDVSVVTTPAYQAADVALRSLQEWQKTQEAKPTPELGKVLEPVDSLDVLRARLDLAEVE